MKYSTWKIPVNVIDETQQAFLKGKHEVFVIWSASASESQTAEIKRCIVPKQKPGISTSGVWVHIEGQELQRIQLDNYAKKERSIVQLHTHPGEDVRMSALDRQWEVVRHVGALSIIVPNYCKYGMAAWEGVNVYEREESDWRLWSPNEIKERLEVL